MYSSRGFLRRSRGLVYPHRGRECRDPRDEWMRSLTTGGDSGGEIFPSKGQTGPWLGPRPKRLRVQPQCLMRSFSVVSGGLQGALKERTARCHASRSEPLRCLHRPNIPELERRFVRGVNKSEKGRVNIYPEVVTIARTCVRTRDKPRLMRVLQTSKEFRNRDLITFLTRQIIAALIDLNDLPTAARVAEEEKVRLKRVSRSLSVDFYNVILKLHVKRKEYPTVLTLMETMRREQILPDVHTMTQLVNCLVDLGQLQRAESLIDDVMPRLNIAPNDYLLTILIKGYAKMGLLDKVLDAEQRCQKVDASLVRTLLRAYMDLRAWDEAERVLAVARTHYYDVSHVACVLISQYALVGRLERAEALFDRLRDGSLRCAQSAVLRAHNALLFAYLTAGAHAKLDALFQRMKREGPTPDVRIYSILVRSAVDRSQTDTALALVQELQSRRMKPDVWVACGMMKCAGNLGSAEMLQQWFNCAVECTPNRVPEKVKLVYLHAAANVGLVNETVTASLASLCDKRTRERLSLRNNILKCRQGGDIEALRSIWASIQRQELDGHGAAHVSILEHLQQAFTSLDCPAEVKEVESLTFEVVSRQHEGQVQSETSGE